jgi:hypothetical protein
LLARNPPAEQTRQQAEVLARLRGSFAEYERAGQSAAGREWFRQVRNVLRAATGRTTERRRRQRPAPTPIMLHPTFAAFGPFAMEEDEGVTWIEWTTPARLPAPIEHWSLRLTTAQAASDDTAGAWQLLQSRLGEMAPTIRASLVRGFCEGGLEPPDTPVTVDSVFDEVTDVVIERGPDDAWTLSFRVASEEEHRWEMVVDDHGVVRHSLD